MNCVSKFSKLMQNIGFLERAKSKAYLFSRNSISRSKMEFPFVIFFYNITNSLVKLDRYPKFSNALLETIYDGLRLIGYRKNPTVSFGFGLYSLFFEPLNGVLRLPMMKSAP